MNGKIHGLIGGTINGRIDTLGTLLNPLPEDYWQENDTENYFLEEETNNILTMEDL